MAAGMIGTMKILTLVLAVALLNTGSLWTQTAPAPVLTGKPAIAYPPIALVAHVTGEVIVRFSIENDGSTSSVHGISGPQMLQEAVASQIKEWKFQIPLAMRAEREFEAVYHFGISAPDETVDESEDDDLDGPPYRPCCGDLGMPSPSASSVQGEVRSTHGTQKIDLTQTSSATASNKCPKDQEDVPTTSQPEDYVERFRACTRGCNDYKVRVYRDGRVEWFGRSEVALKGPAQTNIRSDAASALIERFRTPAFWSACSTVLPAVPPDPEDEEHNSFDLLSAKIGDHIKTVDAFASSGEAMQRIKWAVDKVANTHRWIHGEPALEPYQNMADDLSMPKPGITPLIRATYHFGQASPSPTPHALKRILDTPGVDVDAADESGWTALMYAAKLYGDTEIDLLLKAHASPNKTSLHGDTALMMAAYNGILSEPLLKSGADINARNADGVTVLMLLAQKIRLEELKAALHAGADATATDGQGRTALDYLREASCDKAIVPLPEPWAIITYRTPPACPANTEAYKASAALLHAAMKHPPQ